MTFDDWLPTYLEFRGKAYKLLAAQIPLDFGGLQAEAAILEPIRAESERFRAGGVGYYYHAKIKAIEKFRADGWAMSAVSEVAKASSHKELWVKEDAEGLARSIESRSIRLSQLMRQMGAA